MTPDSITIVGDGPGNVFVYDRTPSGQTLIASHCPNGPTTDLFGTSCPAGDWCADGYQLIRMTEVWPGMLLAESR
jgi:hypothetical protein